jgi:hypothetical protein
MNIRAYFLMKISKNLGSTLLHSISDNELFIKKRYKCHISSSFGKGNMYLLFMEIQNVFAFVSKHIEIFQDQIQT